MQRWALRGVVVCVCCPEIRAPHFTERTDSMATHNRMAFSKADVPDSKRGYPDFDLRDYATRRGLEFLDRGTPAASAPPCRAMRSSARRRPAGRTRRPLAGCVGRRGIRQLGLPRPAGSPRPRQADAFDGGLDGQIPQPTLARARALLEEFKTATRSDPFGQRAPWVYGVGSAIAGLYRLRSTAGFARGRVSFRDSRRSGAATLAYSRNAVRFRSLSAPRRSTVGAWRSPFSSARLSWPS